MESVTSLPNSLVQTKWSDESVNELICKVRNDLIKDFLDERFLREYASISYHVREIDNDRVEEIKKELKVLLTSPINTAHYQGLINQIRETDSATLTERNEELFYKDIERTIRRYIY